jgi:hypothetical protein
MDMTSSRRAFVWLGLLCLALALTGCTPSSDVRTLYVDGTRGCKQPAAEVALWAEPGAGAVDSPQVGRVPHGTRFTVLEESSVYGIRYYRLRYETIEGWLPEPFMETIPPVCAKWSGEE